MNADYLRIGRASDILNKKDSALYRFFEIMPGLLAWSTLIILFIFSLFLPLWVAIFIILFDLYWFLKIIYQSFYLRAGFYKTLRNLKVDWLEKLNNLDSSGYSLKEINHWDEVYQLVIFPMYKEPPELLEQTFGSLMNANYPKDKLLIVLALEERAKDLDLPKAKIIEEKYKDRFGYFLITIHPYGIEGEIAGKGSNINWAGKRAQEEIVDKLGISHRNVLVSTFDIDTSVYPDYFACLTYHYLTSSDPLHSSYQPIPVYTNNFWQAPGFARVISFSTTFWQMMQQAKPEQLITFSSHSMPFEAIVKVGFWQENIVSEDSRIFYQCYFNFDGRWQVVPLYYPVAMDINAEKTLWGTVKNHYFQHRRWAWGVENIPYFLVNAAKNKKISLKSKFLYAYNLIEGSYAWATHSFIIFFFGWLPILMGGQRFRLTTLSLNLPFFAQWILALGMLGIITAAIFAMTILPKTLRPRGIFGKYYLMAQWFVVPFTAIFLSALPALDAQTKLMFGKYLGFWPTPKIRHKAE